LRYFVRIPAPTWARAPRRSAICCAVSSTAAAAIAFEELAIRTLADQRLTGAGRMLLDSGLQASCATA
jgi:hypothetical protein